MRPFGKPLTLSTGKLAAAKAVCDPNKNGSSSLSGLDVLTVTWSRWFSTDKEEVTAMLDNLRCQHAAGTAASGARKPRVLLTAARGLGTEKVIRIVSEAGGNLAAMENCAGSRPWNCRPVLNSMIP